MYVHNFSYVGLNVYYNSHTTTGCIAGTNGSRIEMGICMLLFHNDHRQLCWLPFVFTMYGRNHENMFQQEQNVKLQLKHLQVNLL